MVTTLKLGILLVSSCALLLSLSSIFTRISYDYQSNPQSLLWMRFLIFSLFSFCYVKFKSISLSIPDKKLKITWLSGFFYTLGSGCLLASIFFIPVSLTIVLFYTYPIITLLIDKLISARYPHRLEVICFFTAFFGLILALNIKSSSINYLGVLLAFIGAISMSINYIISDRMLNEIKPICLTFHFALTGLVIVSLFILFAAPFNVGQTTLTNYLAILAASLSFAAAFLFMFQAINLIGAVNTAALLNLEPILTVALSVIILKEKMTGLQLLGAALVVSAIVVLQFFQQHKKTTLN